MRKLLLSVLLCAALVMGLLPTAAFPMELGNTPEAVEEAPTSALEEQNVNEELLSEYGEQKNAPKAADPTAQNGAAEIYVSSTGNDEQNTGTKDLPFATLAKAVDAAADGTTIYVMSDLTMDQCARFYDKSLKITSGEGGPYTITRSADFKQQSDTARSWYNPAMIEVQSSSASSVGLTLSDIVLNDAGMHEGTVFAQAVSGDGNGDNTVYVQDAIIASNATVPCTVTLGKDAVLRNFGGMSAVRATDQAKIVMESGSVIEDTLTGYTRTKGSGADSVGPAGAIWLQGGTLVMEEGSKIRNMDGRGVYADGGKVEIGGGVFVRRGGQFIMNGGAIENNATTAFGGGVCFDASDYGGTVPKIELNAGTIRNNLMQVTVGDEYQITGGISNDLAVTGKDYGKCDRYLYISREAAVGDKAVYFQTGSKTVTPDDSSLDIRLGNTSAANVTALTGASKSMGWNDPLTTLWVQRDGAAELTIGGLTVNDLPVYVLSLPVDETGKVLDASEVQVYEAQKTDTGDIDITLPDVSGNGHAVAIVQPSQNHGTLVINGPETIERNKTGADYPVTYTVTYDMSESMESIIEQSGGEAEYVLTIDQDVRLTGNPGSFNGESIQVTYSLPHSEFKAGDFLLASAKLRITVGQLDYIIPSNVTKTQKIETTYSLTTQVNGGNGTISASKAGLAAGSHETIVFTPDSGYEIDTVTVNGVKAEVLSNTLEVIMDADKTVIVTYKSIPHTHSYGADWKSDADNHWHECPCGDRKDTAAHSFKWVIDKEATATTRGSKHEECTVCGYKKAAVEIPATGSAAKPSDQPDNLGNTTSPKTGDSSNLVLWNALLFISGGAVIGTTVVSRKKKHNR